MKKTLIIALAGMMLFAFTQCGGNGKDNETKNETAVEETKTVNEPPSATGTKQFNDMKAGFEEIEKAINNATTCDEIEQVAMALALSNIAIGLGGGDQYADGEKMTEKEQEKFQEMTEDLLKKAEKKAAELGCEKKEYSL